MRTIQVNTYLRQPLLMLSWKNRKKTNSIPILGDTNPVEVLPSLEPHKFLSSLEAHLLQGLFRLQPLADHQSFLQSTTVISQVSHHLREWRKEKCIYLERFSEKETSTADVENHRNISYDVSKEYLRRSLGAAEHEISDNILQGFA